MERGRPKEALIKYRKASQLSFFESPNFLVYYRIALAQSKMGDRAAARDTISQFSDMLAIYTGEKACTNPRTHPKAVEVMCSEIYGPDDYGVDPGLRLRKQLVSKYRERVAYLVRKNRLTPQGLHTLDSVTQ